MTAQINPASMVICPDLFRAFNLFYTEMQSVYAESQNNKAIINMLKKTDILLEELKEFSYKAIE